MTHKRSMTDSFVSNPKPDGADAALATCGEVTKGCFPSFTPLKVDRHKMNCKIPNLNNLTPFTCRSPCTHTQFLFCLFLDSSCLAEGQDLPWTRDEGFRMNSVSPRGHACAACLRFQLSQLSQICALLADWVFWPFGAFGSGLSGRTREVCVWNCCRLKAIPWHHACTSLKTSHINCHGHPAAVL